MQTKSPKIENLFRTVENYPKISEIVNELQKVDNEFEDARLELVLDEDELFCFNVVSKGRK